MWICQTLAPHSSLQKFNRTKGKGRWPLQDIFEEGWGWTFTFIKHLCVHGHCYRWFPFILPTLHIRDYNSQCRSRKENNYSTCSPSRHQQVVELGLSPTSAGLQESPGCLSFETIWLKRHTVMERGLLDQGVKTWASAPALSPTSCLTSCKSLLSVALIFLPPGDWFLWSDHFLRQWATSDRKNENSIPRRRKRVRVSDSLGPWMFIAGRQGMTHPTCGRVGSAFESKGELGQHRF